VAEKHDFRDIQRKIPQISDFAEKQDLNPPPHGDTAADIAKMFAKKISQKSDFRLKNTIFAKIRSDFCEIPQTKSRKLHSAKKFFHNFRDFPQLYDFREINISPRKSDSAKIGFRKKTFFKIFAIIRKPTIFAKKSDRGPIFCTFFPGKIPRKILRKIFPKKYWGKN
jgi:hypothetical protein